MPMDSRLRGNDGFMGSLFLEKIDKRFRSSSEFVIVADYLTAYVSS